MLVDDRELTERAAQIGSLLERIESLPDPAVRAAASEILQGLLALYGEGLARMLAIVRQRDDPSAGAAMLDAFAADELIAHLLLLHDLHPVDVETRVARALEGVRPYLQSHGGNVELIGVDGGVARLRLQGSCHGCPSSTITLKLAIEEAIWKAAPDLDGIDAEGVAAPPPPIAIPTGFIPVSALTKRTAPSAPTAATQSMPMQQTPQEAGPAWTVIGGLPHLVDGGMTALEVAGQPLVFIKIEETFYAYRDACSACGEPLERGALHGADLACPSCTRHYDVRRAGRCLDAPSLSLEPIPLLVHDDIVKVAVSGQRSAYGN